MFSLTYVSSATTLLTPEQIRDLLAACDQNNRHDDITGMLLYKGGNFMQVLEGEQAAVLGTHARIAADPRHKGLLTLLAGDVSQRQFADWSMGFKLLDSSGSLPAAYNEFLDSPLTGGEFLHNPSRAQKLLLVFKKSM